jgi:hypothetical protein
VIEFIVVGFLRVKIVNFQKYSKICTPIVLIVISEKFILRHTRLHFTKTDELGK